MDAQVILVPLKCIRCETPVPARPDEVAWVCERCGQGLLLDEEEVLLPLDVHYSAAVPENEKGKPYWVAQGHVVLQRDTYGSRNKNKESEQFWSLSRRFFIPAFTNSLEALIKSGTDLLRQPPKVEAGNAVSFESVTLPLKDLPAVAEFIVIAIEAERRDQLSTLEVSVNLADPELWILP